jgi:hypothetical protein
MDKPVITVEPPKGEHIFPATYLTELAEHWKELTAAGKHGEAFKLLEEIIVKSTPMFERLAQYEGFHHVVPLDQLVQAAREKVPRWLLACDVDKLRQGKLFSWFSTCSKNAFRSEVARHRQHTNRHHATGDNLEKFVGQEDHAIMRHDAADDAVRRIRDITTRWGDPHELGSVRFVVDCLVDEERQPPDRHKIVNGVMYAYGLAPEMAKFFYQWGLFALRDALYDKVRAPFTKQDVLRMVETHTFLPDVIDIVGWDRFSELVIKLGGQRIKLPTTAQLTRLHEETLLHRELQDTDLTPEGMEAAARRRGRTLKNAEALFIELSESLSAQRLGEHPLYPEDEV